MSNLYVAKFGGSSVASYEKIKLIEKIVLDDPKRKVIVVSAPGKNKPEDEKSTEMLIYLVNKKEYSVIDKIAEKYCEIYVPFGIEKSEIVKLVKGTLEERLNQNLIHDAMMASVKAFGEEANAKLMAKVFGWKYVEPKEYISVSNDFENAKVLKKTYQKLKKLDVSNTLIIPGFFGYTNDGMIATFSRGGSDLTGAIVAAALNAEEYENFTDCAVKASNIIPNAKKIDVMTYDEMRDLSYLGFSILHSEATKPLKRKGIPIHVRSTNNYPEKGTLILPDRISDPVNPVIGVAYLNGFCSFDIEKDGFNEEIGKVEKMLSYLRKNKISVEFFAGAIDDISLITRESYIKKLQEKDPNIMKTLNEKLNSILGEGGNIGFEENVGTVVIAGKGLRESELVSTKVHLSLAEAGIDVRFISRGSKKRCTVYGVKHSDGQRAVGIIYDKFIR